MEELRRTFGNIDVINLGVSGDRSQNSLWRLERTKKEDYAPKAIILSEGANNVSDNEPACAIASGIRAVISELRSSWPDATVIVLKTLPRGDNFSQADDTHREVYDIVSSTLDPKTFIVDVGEAMTCGGMRQFPQSYYDLKWRTGKAPSPCKYFEDDLVHISKQGYADIVGPAVIKQLVEIGQID